MSTQFSKYLQDIPVFRGRLLAHLDEMKLNVNEKNAVLDFFFGTTYDKSYTDLIKKVGFKMIEAEFDKINKIFDRVINRLEDNHKSETVIYTTVK